MSDKDHKMCDEQVFKQKELNKQKEPNKPQKNEAKEAAIEIEQPINFTEEELINQQRIIDLEQQLLEMQKRERESMLRAKAEVENIRRRTEQDIEKAHKFALERFTNELLPVIDNLERAIELIDKKKDEFTPMLEGLELTLKSFLVVVGKYGVKVIAEKNVPFNPDHHQAMTMIDSVEHESNQVIDIVQKGYILNGRLLRPAMVIVSKAK